MCVERTDYGSGDEISAAWPAGHLGRADRRMEGLLAGWLGQRPAVLLGDGDQGEKLNPNLFLTHSGTTVTPGRHSDDGVVNHYEGRCRHDPKEDGCREY